VKAHLFFCFFSAVTTAQVVGILPIGIRVIDPAHQKIATHVAPGQVVDLAGYGFTDESEPEPVWLEGPPYPTTFNGDLVVTMNGTPVPLQFVKKPHNMI